MASSSHNRHHQQTKNIQELGTQNGCITRFPPPSIRTSRPLRQLLPSPRPQEHPLLSSSTPSSSPRDPSKFTLQQPTTAPLQQPCLPPQSSPRHTPLPAFQQDFALFPSSLPPQQTLQRATPHASRQQPTSNQINNIGAFSAPAHRQTLTHRSSLPAVPTYPWNTANAQNTTNMVNMDPNVAYDGTSSDLGFGAGSLFKPNADFGNLNLFGLDDNLFGSDLFAGTMTNNTEATIASTVSPHELMMGSMDSVPSSSAFPDLTPSSEMLETPNTSPMFTDLTTPAESWAPLFPDDSFNEVEAQTPAAPALVRQGSTSSQVMVHPGGEPRKRSLDASPAPISLGARPSTVAGIRKKSKPLPAIVVDETDPVAVKRARNTAAARKSREKKNAHVETLEARIAELEQMLAERDAKIAQLEAPNGTAAPSNEFHGQDFDLSALL